ncbi:hypothetical protein GF351_03735 [Candidatus Woesearchaeota archaeon]|nr:hypothetical protein [Candidatus Woesearchaeota archaeon]
MMFEGYRSRKENPSGTKKASISPGMPCSSSAYARTLAFLLFTFLVALPAAAAEANETSETVPVSETPPLGPATKDVCAVYFTGVGCPHCARSDPVILQDYLKEYPQLVVIEYEIYQQQENAPLLPQYDSLYSTGFGIPLIIFENDHIVGDTSIIKGAQELIEKDHSRCALLGKQVDFGSLDISSLPGKPKLWTDDRILIRTDESSHNTLLKALLTAENISSVFHNLDYKVEEPRTVPLSGSSVLFDNAIQLDGWLFQWNGEAVGTSRCPSCPSPTGWEICENGTKKRTNYKCGADTDYQCVPYIEIEQCKEEDVETKLTLAKLISLAAVDAINPCALAVLTLMLIAILTYNPKKKRNILLAGLAFTVSVFIMYMFYGLVIIKFFQLVQILTSVRIWMYKILGIVAILLGALNVKDFVKYKPGGVCTEMPISMRPKVKNIISGITSPKGAFVVGLFVTVFLLPCTIGPYVIAGGILSAYELIQTIPPLMLYNLIFVLPMFAITLMVYAGFAKVEDVSGWKEKNIRYLHLIAGVIMFGLGLAMLFGWV